MVEACAKDYTNNTASIYMPFVECLENGQPATDGHRCAKTVGWPTDAWTTIDACTTSSKGNKLMHEIAVATNNLNPPHQWTPWVVMNGKPLTDSQMDDTLIKLVCDAYQGTKPAACNNQKLKISEKLSYV